MEITNPSLGLLQGVNEGKVRSAASSALVGLSASSEESQELGQSWVSALGCSMSCGAGGGSDPCWELGL